ncbi:hypothetical protein [Mesorhizobium sp. L-8-3]|uniref:hypothetical protein n=1 Tax=Mesorhizobium sp. L-8-3 TaxID=2744522 RepID=UPI0019278B11|nr:hypothetical protein [Mesorhizobium sp. L-8-3]
MNKQNLRSSSMRLAQSAGIACAAHTAASLNVEKDAAIIRQPESTGLAMRLPPALDERT